MTTSTVKAACLGTLGLVTLWSTRSAKADDIYTNNTITTPIPLSHEILVYTSNASVVYTDNSTSTLVPYESGIISLPSNTPITSATFDLDFAPGNVSVSTGTVAGYNHTLSLLGLDANNNIVVGTNGQQSYNGVFSNVTYASVQNALMTDTAASLASNVIPNIAFPIASFRANGTVSSFTLTTIFSNDTGTLLVDPTNSSLPLNGSITINPAPEPASAALIGIPALALLARRKRNA